MITISLCMIVKNEEEVLARCLDSVKDIVDEIVIVDTGSTDRTKEIAAAYTEYVYDFPWIEDFSAARNYSFSKGTKEYCMWLDADDVINEENKYKFLDLKRNMNPEVDIVMMKYHTNFDEAGNPIFSYYRERIIKNHKGYQWRSPIHEVITPYGNVIYSETGVEHRKLKPRDPDRNLRIFEKMLADGKKLDSRQQFYYGRELYDHQCYEEAKIVLLTFLDSGVGWMENQIEACRQLAYCYYRLDMEKEALQALFRSFVYDTPRAEICCDIGRHFFDRQQMQLAIFWYERAANTERKDRQGGFVLPDSYDYTPYLQLCVCYDKLGDYSTANAYNEKAGMVKPESAAFLANREYFRKKLHSM